MPNDAGDEVIKISDERKYLEQRGEFRTNLLLVFATFFYSAYFSADLSFGYKALILFMGGFISLFYWFAILRTQALIDVLLRELKKRKNKHPYGLAATKANTSLGPAGFFLSRAVPFIIVASFPIVLATEILSYDKRAPTPMTRIIVEKTQ